MNYKKKRIMRKPVEKIIRMALIDFQYLLGSRLFTLPLALTVYTASTLNQEKEEAASHFITKSNVSNGTLEL